MTDRLEPLSDAYRVDIDEDGCKHCRAGRTWCVVGPDGIAFGVSYRDRNDAADLADMLNIAYAMGADSKSNAPPPVNPDPPIQPRASGDVSGGRQS